MVVILLFIYSLSKQPQLFASSLRRWADLLILLTKGHNVGYRLRSFSALSLPQDYHNPMLIQVVTAMNTNNKERADQLFSGQR